MPRELLGLCTSSPSFPWATLPPPSCWAPAPWHFLLEGKEKAPPAQKNRTNPARGGGVVLSLHPEPSSSHISPEVFAVSLEICLFLAVISPLPTFSCRARSLPVPVSTPVVPCSIPVFSGAGGPPPAHELRRRSPASDYSLLEAIIASLI